jgi:hypothetical protein
MATLRAFQNEMEEIHARELAKHRPPNIQANRDHVKDRNITQPRPAKAREDEGDPLKRNDSLASGMVEVEEEVQVSPPHTYSCQSAF